MIDEVLVLHQPYRPFRSRISRSHGPRAIRHGIRRIADVFVISLGVLARQIKREPALRLQVDAFRSDRLWRPAVITLPAVRARLKDLGFGKVERSLPLEPVGKPLLLDLLSVIKRGIRSELDRSQAGADPIPLPMVPGTADEVVQV